MQSDIPIDDIAHTVEAEYTHMLNHICGIRYLMRILFSEGFRRFTLVVVKLSGMHASVLLEVHRSIWAVT